MAAPANEGREAQAPAQGWLAWILGTTEEAEELPAPSSDVVNVQVQVATTQTDVAVDTQNTAPQVQLATTQMDVMAAAAAAAPENRSLDKPADEMEAAEIAARALAQVADLASQMRSLQSAQSRHEHEAARQHRNNLTLEALLAAQAGWRQEQATNAMLRLENQQLRALLSGWTGAGNAQGSEAAASSATMAVSTTLQRNAPAGLPSTVTQRQVNMICL